MAWPDCASQFGGSTCSEGHACQGEERQPEPPPPSSARGYPTIHFLALYLSFSRSFLCRDTDRSLPLFAAKKDICSHTSALRLCQRRWAFGQCLRTATARSGNCRLSFVTMPWRDRRGSLLGWWQLRRECIQRGDFREAFVRASMCTISVPRNPLPKSDERRSSVSRAIAARG